MAKDFYQVLGIKRDASTKEIKQAYRKLAREFHPDVNPDDKKAEERFKEINNAHEVLSDTEKRARYDRWGDKWEQAAAFEKARAPMKPRSERRRDERKGKDPHGRSWPINIWAASFIGVGITIIVVGGIFLASGGGDDDGPTETPITSASASASASDAVLITPSTPDEMALEAIARRMIESLPNGEWSSLYSDFTDPFHQRCSLEEFTAAGEAAAEEQGANLARIRYLGVEGFNISETRAALLIVGEITGRSQYTTGANFEKVDGVWRISPVADTTGCEAFDRISG